MKNYFLLLTLFLFTCHLMAQSPAKFRYQGVARDASGAVITDPIELRLSLLRDSENGTSQYVEQHVVTPNAQGVFSLIIGNGAVQSGDLDIVSWGQHEYWLKVELKTQGDLAFNAMGTTQLLSVPYAMYAESAGNHDAQTLSLEGNTLYISGGNSIELPLHDYIAGDGINVYNNIISADDESPANELQTLSINGNNLTISDGNTVSLPTHTHIAGNGIQITGNTISATDASTTNEIQTISLNGQQLTLSNGGGSVTLPGGASLWAQNGDVTHNMPTTSKVAIGGTTLPGSKFGVSANGTEHAVNAYTHNTGNALNAYCNSTGKGIQASSLNGVGAHFSSVNSHALITGSGKVGIGVDNPTYKLDVNGNLRAKPTSGVAAHFESANSTVVEIEQGQGNKGLTFHHDDATWEQAVDNIDDFSFYYNGTAKSWISRGDGSYHLYSDRTLKTDIDSVSGILEKFSQLQAYTYRMKDAPLDSPVSLGLMAQEVEAQFPNLVTMHGGYKSICYDHITVLSVEAIKEQQHEIDALRAEVEALKALVHTLTTQQPATGK